jgi:hypothetical protein
VDPETSRRQEELMLSRLTSREAVLRAVREFDRLGRDTFLDQYGFGRARRYYLRVDGRDYDSKAIAGVAYGFQHPDEGPLARSEFSGGEATVKRALGALGFEVVDRKGNGG